IASGPRRTRAFSVLGSNICAAAALEATRSSTATVGANVAARVNGIAPTPSLLQLQLGDRIASIVGSHGGLSPAAGWFPHQTYRPEGSEGKGQGLSINSHSTCRIVRCTS